MKKLVLLFWLALAAFEAGAQVDTSRITFQSGGLTLSGKLLMPRGKANLPALVFLVGSSGNSSHQSNYRRFLADILEKPFARNFALLYFDKRGVNESGGKWHTADFFDRAEDGINAVRYLKTLRQIDTTKIGVVGHSQGGWICQIMASRYHSELAFAASLAGPAVSVFEQLAEDYGSQLECRGMDALRARSKAVRKTKTAFRASRWLGIFNKNLRQLRVIGKYKPDSQIKNMEIPFLFMFGENDGLVCPAASMARLNRIFTGKIPAHIRTTTIPGSTHSFYVAGKCHEGKSSALRYSPQFESEFQGWITEQVR